MLPRIAMLDIGRSLHWLKSPNFGLLFIAAYLRKELAIDPKDILYVDQSAGDDVLEKLGSRPWDVLGVSALSVCAHELNTLAPQIRKRWPDRTVVLGGVHVSAVPEVALKQSHISYGIVGDGERSFAHVVSGLGQTGAVPRDTPGLVWIENDKLANNGVDAQQVDDLDSIPPLPLDMLKRDYYFRDFLTIQGTRVPALPWIATRGCASRCRFCSVNVTCGPGVRYQSAGRIVADLERLVRDHGVPGVHFQDDDLPSSRKRIIELCEGIMASPLMRGFHWACYSRADHVDADVLSLMKRAGCVQVAFGLESGSQRMLTYLKKGSITVEDGRRAIAACKKAGMRSMGMFMIGSPSETKEEVLETFAFIHENPIDFVTVFTTTPSPGSEFWNLAVERGLIDPATLDWRTLIFDQRPVLADSVDATWLYRRYLWEYLRVSLRNYSLPMFVLRAVRAAGVRLFR